MREIVKAGSIVAKWWPQCTDSTDRRKGGRPQGRAVRVLQGAGAALRVAMPEMKLDPFERVDDTPFALSKEALLRDRGEPWRALRNDVGLNEMDYGDVVYRFQDCGRLEEITLQAEVLSIGNLAVPFACLAAFVRAHDPAAFERAGFLVSPGFGLAFDPSEPSWVTALARHCLPQWKRLS
ncbi:hypothetical protein SAMN05444747_1193 [Variovorax sp. OV329]|nr:hypothetical protein SAMN05444747_1193 [Variovorax sp. OV329]